MIPASCLYCHQTNVIEGLPYSCSKCGRESFILDSNQLPSIRIDRHALQSKSRKSSFGNFPPNHQPVEKTILDEGLVMIKCSCGGIWTSTLKKLANVVGFSEVQPDPKSGLLKCRLDDLEQQMATIQLVIRSDGRIRDGVSSSGRTGH